MTSTRPYLIRAFYEWIADNNCTPHIVVNATLADVSVPTQYIEAGQIVLNVAANAVQGLQLGNEAIQFQARFSGIAHFIYVPIIAVLAIYARENGRGMVFAEEEDADPLPPHDKPPTLKSVDKAKKEKEGDGKGGKGKGGKPPFLTVVK